MDRCGIRMEKIDRPEAAGLLSQQVTGARYFFLNLAPGRRERLTLALGGREHCNPDYAIARREFPFYVLEYVRSGQGTLRLDRRRHALRPGMVYAYAPTTDCEIHNISPHGKLFELFHEAHCDLLPVSGSIRVSKNGVAETD